MLSIRVGEEVYGLDDESAAELVRRVSEVDPVLQNERDVSYQRPLTLAAPPARW